MLEMSGPIFEQRYSNSSSCFANQGLAVKLMIHVRLSETSACENFERTNSI